MEKTFEVELYYYSSELDYVVLEQFLEYCQDFLNNHFSNKKIECRVVYDEEDEYSFKNPNGLLPINDYLFEDTDDYDDMCQFLSDYEVDIAEITNLHMEKETHKNRWGEPEKKLHCKMTITLFESEVAEAIRKDREEYAWYQYEQEMNEESAYYALGGSDYDRFKENGGDLGDMME